MSMTRRIGRVLALALLLAPPLWARWTHFAPAQAPAGEALQLEFLDPEGLQAPLEAQLFAELDGRALDPLQAAELAAGRVLFSVPGERLAGGVLSYHAEIRSATAAERVPAAGSWRVALAPAQELALVELLSEPEIEAEGEALLAFAAAGEQADLASAQLWIDNQPAPGEVEADPWLVTWRGSLPAGPHQVELRLKDRQGRELAPQRVTVRVLGAEAVPAGFEAAAWQEFNMDFQDSRTNAQWQRYHAGQARFRAWRGRGEEAWDLKGRVLLSALDLESDILQPQSRLSLDLDHKGFLLGVGDRQPEYGQAILSGTRVRGAELKLDFSQFGLHLVSGHSQEARDPVAGLGYNGAYARQLSALDLRMGRERGLFEGGFTVLKAKDDVGSLGASAGADPQDNAVLGTRLDLNAFRGHLSARNQASLSLYNSNIRGGPWTKADLDSLGGAWQDLPDPSAYDNIIVINEYFSPMDLAKGDLLTGAAILSNWHLGIGPNETLVDFRRVGGAYHSLGASFVTPDQQELRVTDRFRVWQNQIYVDLGLGQTSDNLDGQFDNSVGTHSRDLLSLGLGWYPHGRDLQARLGFEQQSESNESLDLLPGGATPDAIQNAKAQQIDGALNQVRLGLSGGLNWLARRHQWSLNLVTQQYADNVGTVPDAAGTDTLRADRTFSSNQIGLGWQVNVTPRWRLDTGFTIYGSDYDDASQTDYGYWSLRAALGRAWLGGRLQATGRGQFQSVTSETGNAQDAFTRTDLGGDLSWRLRQGLDLTARLDWQSWAGDRDDSFLKTVLRLSQEF
jgi:hypothetical protein